MSTRHIRNISISDYRIALKKLGCNWVGIKDGHEKWTRKDLHRPVIFQTHIDPVPERIIASNNRTLGITKKQFLDSFD
jgi:hypothetical protein